MGSNPVARTIDTTTVASVQAGCLGTPNRDRECALHLSDGRIAEYQRTGDVVAVTCVACDKRVSTEARQVE